MQVEHMKVKLDMKDINKISAKEHFKCIFLMIRGKKHIFEEMCLYEAVGSLSVMHSLFPHALWERSQVPVLC